MHIFRSYTSTVYHEYHFIDSGQTDGQGIKKNHTLFAWDKIKISSTNS